MTESRHWTATERLAGRAAAIGSLDVRRILMHADYRRRHPTLWERLAEWRRAKLKRLTEARVVVS